MIGIKDRIIIFNKIRDLPYKISICPFDTSCSTKTRLLGEILFKYGLECRVGVCIFQWKDLKLPSRILNQLNFSVIPHRINHTFLRVKIPETNNWITVDPTWDKKLINTFDISEWDGLNDTKLAVPTKRLTEKRNALGNFLSPANIKCPKMIKNDKFIIAFNGWLEEVRRMDTKQN
jgi:hypothetical protein